MTFTRRAGLLRLPIALGLAATWLSAADQPLQDWGALRKLHKDDNPGRALPQGALARFPKSGSKTDSAVWGLGFAPHGRWLMVANVSSEVRLWDLSTGKPFRSFSVGERATISEAVLSQDGKVLAARTGSGPTRATLHVWDVETGHERWHRDVTDLDVSTLGFAPDGRTLALACKDTLRLWTADAGKESLILTRQTVDALDFSPDGKLLALAEGASVRFWNLGTGQWDQDRPRPRSGGYSVRFSPDGSLLACGLNSQAAVWNLGSGKRTHELGDHSGAIFGLAFSPDGRNLATGCWDGKVRIWEVATGKMRRRFEEHPDRVFRVAYSPDGRTVASGSAKGDVLLWDVTGLATDPSLRPERLAPAILDELWRDLQGDDGARAYRAVCALAGAPRQAVPYLKDRLRPATLGTAQVAQLLLDLDADQFQARVRASGTLAQLWKAAEPALRQALLTQSPSLEVRRRIDKLLDKLDAGSPPTELLAVLRATEALEIMSSPEAREVLQSLACGAPGAPLTQEAKASLTRLIKSKTASPKE